MPVALEVWLLLSFLPRRPLVAISGIAHTVADKVDILAIGGFITLPVSQLCDNRRPNGTEHPVALLCHDRVPFDETVIPQSF